jgi:hypothetical protein
VTAHHADLRDYFGSICQDELMKLGSILVAALLAFAACKSSDKPAARKLRKLDFKTTIDDRGRLQVAFRMFDAKHELMPVAGSYTVEVTTPEGAAVCKAAGELAPGDFSDKGAHKATWHEAGCPADPGADELKVNVKVTVPGGGKGKGKDDKGKDDGKDAMFDRQIRVPARSIYERLPVKQPAEARPAGGSSAATPAEKPAEGPASAP